MKKAIGLIIKEMINEKRLKITPLAETLGMSRQSVYQTYSRVDMTEGEITRWATALGVSRDEIIRRANEGDSPSSKESIVFAEEVLTNIQKMLEEELKEKNEQIRALQKALEQAQSFSSALLGKSPEYPDSRVIPMYQAAMLPADIA